MIDESTLPRGREKRVAVETMFDRVAPRYDLLNRVISLGLDRRWRDRTVGALGLPAGAIVLDLACGTGDLCRGLEAAGLEPVGIDFSTGMLAVATTSAPLVRADVVCLPMPDASVDGVVCGFALRNFVSVGAFFAECARVLRPGGRFAALDAAEPDHPLLRAGYALWFHRVVPWLGARLSPDPGAYRYLPRSTAYLPQSGALVSAVEAAGFAAVQRRTMTGGAVQLITGTRR